MNDLRIGSLCTGWGGLDTAVQAVLGGRLAWVADPEPGPAAILAHHHPDVPNLGDIRTRDWPYTIAPVDVLTAGFPCQDISHAGKRVGIGGKRSGLWKAVAAAVRGLRPGLVVLENVAAIRSKGRGLDVVIADLAEIGYDVRWTCVRAGDPETGAPHKRDRWIAVAYPADADPERGGWVRRARDIAETCRRDEPADRGHHTPGTLRLLPTPTVALAGGGQRSRSGSRSGEKLLSGIVAEFPLLPTPTARMSKGAGPLNRRSQGDDDLPTRVNRLPLLPTPKASDGPHGGPNQRDGSGNYYLPGMAVRLDEQWIALDGTDYGPAIRRWENILDHPAPCPTEPGTRGNRRLNPAFAEWMMGVPGLVTGTPGLDRRQQLTAIGNGAMPRQMAVALRFLLQLDRAAVAS